MEEGGRGDGGPFFSHGFDPFTDPRNFAEILAKTGTFSSFGRARKITLLDLKNFFENPQHFLKIRLPPRENPRSAPAFSI